ncbi:SDR family oxidoreductase [Williamsia sp. DF01-3]|uniref:SDR family oxidoreductase n=1 Tax=Williamsia sp. DF01-3 TaxID=2934157 RepID=UPI001FF2C96C|nr:SDR family oxidoreductase [Williamsia sp. DF01-3]MCK0517585.1 SDR family oxidoreductase [Williamsia sp. DF01-3]
MSRIAIIGGHGKIALKLAKILTGQGHQVSSLIRNPDQSDDITQTGATPVIADVENLSTDEIAEAIKGHDAVVFSAGAGGGSPERTYAVDRDAAIRSIDAAQQAGITRYVQVSYFGAGPDHGVPEDNSFHAYAEAKAAADEHLRKTTLLWTIVGPSALTDEPGTGRIATKERGAEAGTSVSRDDVAEVLAAVLETQSSVGTTVEFTRGQTPIADAVKGV